MTDSTIIFFAKAVIWGVCIMIKHPIHKISIGGEILVSFFKMLESQLRLLHFYIIIGIVDVIENHRILKSFFHRWIFCDIIRKNLLLFIQILFLILKFFVGFTEWDKLAKYGISYNYIVHLRKKLMSFFQSLFTFFPTASTHISIGQTLLGTYQTTYVVGFLRFLIHFKWFVDCKLYLFSIGVEIYLASLCRADALKCAVL